MLTLLLRLVIACASFLAATDQTFTEKEVLRIPGKKVAYPRWSADGRRILFQSDRSGKWQVSVMNRDGSEQKQVTSGDCNNNFVDWSPDNGRVAFVSDRDGNEEIYLCSIDGSNLVRLTNHPARDIHPYFAPDGKSLLFNSTRDDPDAFEIYQINLDGTGLRRLTQTKHEETCARFSPDMKHIVYLHGDAVVHNDEVYVIDADGSNRTNLSKSVAAEGWPTWSPDGRFIYFSSTRDGGRFCLFRMDLTGNHVEQLTHPRAPLYDARPSLSPGTGDILINREDDDTIAIFLLSPVALLK
jgi:TolB protein